MKNAKRIIAGLLAVLLLLGVVFVATGCSAITVNSVKKDPEKQLIESYNKTKEVMKASFSGSPLSMMAQALEKGCIKLWINDKTSGTISNTLYADQSNNKYANIFEKETNGSKSNMNLYINEDAAAIYMPEMFGETVYGINLETIREDMENTQLWKLAGISYKDFMELYGDLITGLEGIIEKENSASYLEFKKMLDDIKSVIRQCTVTVEEHGVLTGTDMVTAINIKYSMSMDQMNQIIDIVLNLAEDSLVRTLKDELKKVVSETNATIDLTISINPKTQMIMKVEAKLNCIVDEQPQYIVASVDFGKDPASSSLHQIRISISNGEGEETSLTLIYEKMDSNGIYDRRLKVKYSGAYTDEILDVRFQWNKVKENYSLIFNRDNEAVTIGGKCKVDNNKLEISIDSVDNEVDSKIIDVHLIAEVGTEVPAMPEYTNIFQASEQELQTFIDAAKNKSDFDNWEDGSEDDWEYTDGYAISIKYVTASGNFGFSFFDTDETSLYDVLVNHGVAEVSADGTTIKKMINSDDPDGTRYNVYVGNIPIVGSFKEVAVLDDMEIVISAAN